MKKYTSEEVQDISANFRNVARRLSRTDYSQCDSNLKRFMSLIELTDIISSFITKHNTRQYDISNIIKSRGWLDPFEVSSNFNEEISLSFQLLKYSVENFDGDFTQLYGTRVYTSTKSTANDEMHKFIEHIIDPLIDHIGEYLRKYYDNIAREEQKSKPAEAPSFTAHNSTVVISSTIDGNVTTNVSISETTKTDAIEIISAIRRGLGDDTFPNKDDIKDIIIQIEEEVRANQKPKKGLLIALKTLCVGGATVLPLVTALIELFAK